MCGEAAGERRNVRNKHTVKNCFLHLIWSFILWLIKASSYPELPVGPLPQMGQKYWKNKEKNQKEQSLLLLLVREGIEGLIRACKPATKQFFPFGNKAWKEGRVWITNVDKRDIAWSVYQKSLNICLLQRAQQWSNCYTGTLGGTEWRLAPVGALQALPHKDVAPCNDFNQIPDLKSAAQMKARLCIVHLLTGQNIAVNWGQTFLRMTHLHLQFPISLSPDCHFLEGKTLGSCF